MTQPLLGFTIGITADRRSAEQISMLEGRGANCLHGAMIQTHPLRPEDDIRADTEAFLAARPDIVLLSTGIGLRAWLDAADSISLGDAVRGVLRDATVIARGPKAAGAATTAGIEVAYNAPSATSDELLAHLATLQPECRRVAVQLDGDDGRHLLGRITELGAEPLPISVYRWTLPDDRRPAERLLNAVCAGKVDAITFTARPTVANFITLAERLDRLPDVHAAIDGGMKVFCVGPVCAAYTVERGLGTPHEPRQARLGSMITTITDALGTNRSTAVLAGHTVEMQGRMVEIDGEAPVLLPARERQLLDVLLARPGVVHSKHSLLETVWAGAESDPHVVETTIGRLRSRLGAAGGGIETVMRRGYRCTDI